MESANHIVYNRIKRPFTKRKQIVKQSFGIVCARYNHTTNKVEILLIHKRLSFSYVEFVMKNHKDVDGSIMPILNGMTHEEKMDILSLDFGKMWYRIWQVDPDSKNAPKLSVADNDNYQICKQHFEKKYMADKGERLRMLVSRSVNGNCPWELPKGRKLNIQEKDLVCAIREFREETGFDSDKYVILPDIVISTSTVSGHIKYANRYYVALARASPCIKNDNRFKFPKINYGNITQISEIDGIAWMDHTKIQALENPYALSKILKRVNKLLRREYKITTLAQTGLI